MPKFKKIVVAKKKDSIKGAPWGAPSDCVVEWNLNAKPKGTLFVPSFVEVQKPQQLLHQRIIVELCFN